MTFCQYLQKLIKHKKMTPEKNDNTPKPISEKSIENHLVKRVRENGGEALKFYSQFSTGYPDRVVMLPGGRIYWVELKAPGKKPTKLQTEMHEKLRKLGQVVLVIDSKETVNSFITGIKLDLL